MGDIFTDATEFLEDTEPLDRNDWLLREHYQDVEDCLSRVSGVNHTDPTEVLERATCDLEQAEACVRRMRQVLAGMLQKKEQAEAAGTDTPLRSVVTECAEMMLDGQREVKT